METATASIPTRLLQITGQLPRGRRPDGRTHPVRRTRELIAGFLVELGITDKRQISAVLATRMRRAAELLVAGEIMRARALKGEDINHLALVRIENLAARAIVTLQLDRKRDTGALELRPVPAAPAPAHRQAPARDLSRGRPKGKGRTQISRTATPRAAGEIGVSDTPITGEGGDE